MTWAMDECSLITEFSTQTLSQLDPGINTELTDDVLTDHNLINNPVNSSADNNCNTFCVGWTHLNYIGYTTPIVNISKTHCDVALRSLIYHFIKHEPPTEPPKI